MAGQAEGTPRQGDGEVEGKGKAPMTREAVAILEASRMIPLIDVSVSGETPKVKEVTRRDRILAASVGATLTSLTMTPFDVVKTRLQTQPAPQAPPPLFQPQVTPSTSASCCQKTYFTTNSEALLCRFDPRQSSAFLPSAGGPSPSASGIAAAHHASPGSGIRPFSRQAMAALIPSSSGFTSLGGGAASASIVLSPAEAACVFPDSATASKSLGQSTSTSANRSATGIFEAFALIVRNEGPSALWRGLSPGLAMSVPSQAVYMVGYDFLRRSSFTHAPSIFWSTPGVRPTSTGEGLASRYRTFIAPLIAGSVSRTAVAILFSPFELVRTRLQALPHSSASSASTTAATIVRDTLSAVRSEGPTTLWRGLGATLWRDVPFSAVYWASYEYTRRRLTGGRGLGERHEGDKKYKTIAASFIAGSTSGCLAAIVTNPFDVVKTRRQASTESGGEGTVGTLRRVAREEGRAALMRGLTPRLAKIVPACGIMIASYEGLAQVLAEL